METLGRIAQTPGALDFTVENVEKVGVYTKDKRSCSEVIKTSLVIQSLRGANSAVA